jgi:photosystem II stability/assembly factor-like uncharacterized protein
VLLLAGVSLHAEVMPTHTWMNTEPGGGGAFSCIGAGPSGTIIACSDLSGVYRSVDRGKSWDVIGYYHGLTSTHASAVGFDQVAPNIIYVGTARGLFRSANAGEEFQQVIPSGYITDIAIAPSDPHVAYASRHPKHDSTQGQVYRTADRGLTWRRVFSASPSEKMRIVKLVVHPTDAETVYLVAGKTWFAESPGALYRSTDGGVNWSRLAEGCGEILDMALDPSDPRVMYVTTHVDLPGWQWAGCLYKSVDEGQTWEKKADHTGAVLLKEDQPEVVRVVDVGRDAQDPESGVWESVDGGGSWRRKSSPSDWDPGWQVRGWVYEKASAVAKTLGQDLSDPDAIFWVDGQFVFGSVDGGTRFQNLFTHEVRSGWWRTRGISNTCVISLAISEASPDEIYASFFDLGLWRSTDRGVSWQSCNHEDYTHDWKGRGGNTSTVLADPTRPGVVWATMAEPMSESTLLRSRGGGAIGSWEYANHGMPRGYISGLSLDRASHEDERTLFVTCDGDVYRSTDDGQQWSRVLADAACRFTAVDQLNGKLVYAGGEGGLWRSLEGGTLGTWQRIGTAEMVGGSIERFWSSGYEGVYDIRPDPSNSGWVYVAVKGKGKGLYRSKDSGDTWDKLWTDDYMRCVAVDPRNPDILYATSSAVMTSGGDPEGSHGVIRSTDGGKSWTQVNEGLAWPFAIPVAVDTQNPSVVFVGSPGTGYHKRVFGDRCVRP